MRKRKTGVSRVFATRIRLHPGLEISLNKSRYTGPEPLERRPEGDSKYDSDGSWAFMITNVFRVINHGRRIRPNKKEIFCLIPNQPPAIKLPDQMYCRKPSFLIWAVIRHDSRSSPVR